MMWPRKRNVSPPTKPVVIPDDIGEAVSMRERAQADHREAEQQAPVISRLTTYLTDRRAMNHFGESIQITYTRRGHA